MATNKKASVGETLAKLKDTAQDFSVGSLYALSSLSDKQQEEFEAGWPEVPFERRRRAAATLIELGEDDIDLDFSGVFFFLLGDSDAEVRGKAIDGLWEDESRELLNKLLNLLANDPSETVREKAAMALARFAYQAEVGKLKERLRDKLYNALLEQVGDKERISMVGRRCIEALGYFGQDDRVLKLIERAYNSDDELVKGSALRAMGRSINKRWLPEVGKELSSREPLLRYEAVQAAGEMGSDELLQPVIGLVNDRDREVQMAAIWSLGQIGGPEASRVLRELTQSEKEEVAGAANDALAEINYSSNPLNVIN